LIIKQKRSVNNEHQQKNTLEQNKQTDKWMCPFVRSDEV